MKKLIALAVCLLITVSALAGCVARGDTAQTSGSTNLSIPQLISHSMSTGETFSGLSEEQSNSLYLEQENEYFEDFDDLRLYLFKQAEASPKYEQRKIEYQQYSDTLVEFLKRPEIVKLCSLSEYTNQGPVIYLQDYNLDNIPEIVIRFFSIEGSFTKNRYLVCDLKTGKVMGALYNTNSYIYIGKNENGSEYVFVEECSEFDAHYSYSTYSRLIITDENKLVRDRYLFAENLYRDEEWNETIKWYADIPLAVGNSYKPYFLNCSWVPVGLMPQECEVEEQVLKQSFLEQNVRIEKAVYIGDFRIKRCDDTEEYKYVFIAKEGFEEIENEIAEEYSAENVQWIYDTDATENMEDFFAEDFWDEYTYMYEG